MHQKQRMVSIHTFDKKELDLIASIVSELEYDKLKLPIYLEMTLFDGKRLYQDFQAGSNPV